MLRSQDRPMSPSPNLPRIEYNTSRGEEAEEADTAEAFLQLQVVRDVSFQLGILRLCLQSPA